MRWVILALFLGATGAMPMAAPAGADIVFKKARPAGGGGKRLDVQITPEEDWYRRTNAERKARRDALANAPDNRPADGAAGNAQADGLADPPVLVKPAVDGQDWFWQANSPALEDAAFNRMEAALLSLGRNPAAQAKLSPRLGTYRKLADLYGRDILLATLGQEISPALVLAVIGVESSGRADAVSPAGAVGVMQLMEATASRFDVMDRADPAQSIRGGAAYLSWLLAEFKGDPLLALAAYNAGENAVKRHGGVPPYPETRGYVPKVVAAWGVARALCMTPPRHPTDGCVFKKTLAP